MEPVSEDRQLAQEASQAASSEAAPAPEGQAATQADSPIPSTATPVPAEAPVQAEAQQANGQENTDAKPEANAAAETSATSEVLTFRQHMWDSFELLWQRRVVPSRRQLEALITTFRERAFLERQYARGMAQSVSRLEAVAQEGPSVPIAMEAVICTMRNRAEQSASLADELEQDVAGTIDAMLRQHAEVSRRVLADGQRLLRNWPCRIRECLLSAALTDR